MSAWPQLVEAASEPYRAAGRMAYGFARGKLSRDPVFETIVSRGLLARRDRILDLGCGQGLLAACLFAQNGFRQPPSLAFRGIERVDRYVERARIAVGNLAKFTRADVRRADFGSADGIVILDVLHYVAYADQREILERAHRALHGTGVLLLRVGDADGGYQFRLGKWVDTMVLLGSGRGLQRLYCRTAAEWQGLLSAVGFHSESIPLSRRSPFANVLLVARPR